MQLNNTVVVECAETMYNFYDSLFHCLHHSAEENQQFDHDKKSLLHPMVFLTI